MDQSEDVSRVDGAHLRDALSRLIEDTAMVRHALAELRRLGARITEAALALELQQGRPPAAFKAKAELQTGQWYPTQCDPTASIASEMARRLAASPRRGLMELQALHDGGPVGLALLDNQLRFVNLNRRLAEMHGLRVAAHIGRSIAEVEVETYATAAPALHRALHGETVTDLRLDCKLAGRIRSYAASYHPVRDEADAVIGVSVAVIDVTDHLEERKLRISRTITESVRSD